MNRQEFEKIISEEFKNISEFSFEKIDTYKSFLQEWNQKINLTRLDSEEKIYKDYFYESIIPYKGIDFKKIQCVLDIGSGSGIPGIVLKILFPHISLLIIESSGKKSKFMSDLVKHLELKNVEVKTKRAEDILPTEREKFDIVTSRAVAPLKIILEVSIPYAKVNGLIIEPKSTNLQEEIQNINFLLKKMDSKLLSVDSFESLNGVKHNVVKIQKLKPTNKTYPREWNKIISRPL